MPLPALKKIAKKHHTSLSSAEDKWEEAKNIVSKQYSKDDPKYWGTVMNITKAKIKKHSRKRKKNESIITSFDMFESIEIPKIEPGLSFTIPVGFKRIDANFPAGDYYVTKQAFGSWQAQSKDRRFLISFYENDFKNFIDKGNFVLNEKLDESATFIPSIEFGGIPFQSYIFKDDDGEYYVNFLVKNSSNIEEFYNLSEEIETEISKFLQQKLGFTSAPFRDANHPGAGMNFKLNELEIKQLLIRLLTT